MANTKITDLTELAAKPATDDILAIVDVTGTDTTKKITVARLMESDVTGNATTATTATVANTVATADTTDTSCSVALFEAATGNQAAKTDAGLAYNAGTGTLTATALVGPLTGSVAGAIPANATDTGTAGTIAWDASLNLMRKFRQLGKLDSPMREVGDALVRGIMSREDSALLPTGFVADAKNVRMNDGTATTRNGYVQKVSLGATTYSANYFGGIGSDRTNKVALFEAEHMRLWDGVSTSSVRFDKNLIIQENLDGILTEDGNLLRQEVAEVFTSLGTFSNSNEGIQFANKEIVFKGLGEILPVSLSPALYLGGPAQTWDGDPGYGFEVDPGIPETDYGIVVGDRMAIQSDKDQISFSDLANPSNFDVLNKFTFGKGDGDDVVGMAPVPENAAIVFKRRSTWAISDLELLPNAFRGIRFRT